MLKMPERAFRWLNKNEIRLIDWATVDSDHELGYFVECKLHYPAEIREYTKDFPLCAENKIITYSMLSSYQKYFLQSIYGKYNYSQKNLQRHSWIEKKCELNSNDLQFKFYLNIDISSTLMKM